MDIAKLATDPALEQIGTWIEYDHETKFFVRSIRSKSYRETYQRELDAMRRVTRKPTQEQTEEMLQKCYAQSILLNWKGVTDNGTAIDCTIENRLRVFKTCPSVWDFVIQSVNAYETFHKEELEAAKAAVGERSPTS
jgi:hypothetical protein